MVGKINGILKIVFNFGNIDDILTCCVLDNTFNNDIDDDDDQEAASSAEAETAAKIEKLPDHLHQAAGHALLLRARTGTDGHQ